ncbi:MAG: type III-A CRISPR-associated RAMP protein Csm5, partial [Leptospiraceae bacterium]|nr:type III-A CRISPR-associated RAMP protein Csm5 [Leptospiraceae bacterium]
MQEIKAKIEFISPIHVGSGEVITPLDYFIKDGKLHKLNFNKFVAMLSDKERDDLLDDLNRNDFLKLRNFAETHFKPEAIEYSIPVSSKVIQEYNSKKNELNNRLEISVFPFDGVMRHPYIPGSSIKGALRTALLERFLLEEDSQADGKELKGWFAKTNHYTNGSMLESYLLKCGHFKNQKWIADIHRDIFRVLKVFDVPLNSEDTEIVNCINFSPKRNANIPMRLQVTKSNLSDIGKNHEKKLTIVWDEGLKEAKMQSGNGLFQKKFSLEELGSACNAHYFKVLFWEYKEFYKENTEPIFNILKNLYTNLREDQFLIRLG